MPLENQIGSFSYLSQYMRKPGKHQPYFWKRLKGKCYKLVEASKIIITISSKVSFLSLSFVPCKIMSLTWYCATSFSVNWWDTYLMDRLFNGCRIVWMAWSRNLQCLNIQIEISNKQCPSGDHIGTLDSGIECTLSSVAGDISLSGVVDTHAEGDIVQRDFERFEEWAHKNLMKLKKARCNVLQLSYSAGNLMVNEYECNHKKSITE